MNVNYGGIVRNIAIERCNIAACNRADRSEERIAGRGRHQIPKCKIRRAKDPKEGPFTADEAGVELGVTMTAIHRWLREGILAGTQATPGAPWRILLTEEVRRRLSGGEAPVGWVGLSEAARRLGLSKSYVAYLAKTGQLEAVQTIVRNTLENQCRIGDLWTTGGDV